MVEKGILRQGERKNAAVLFADMAGSTSISQQLDPEELDNLMTTLFSRFEAIVSEYGGEVEKYIGDAMVAVFGARTTHEDDARRAVSAGLDLLEQVRITALDDRYKKLDLNFRIGVNRGLIATGMRGEYEVVTGDTMSIAARLQTWATPGSVVVAESVLAECGDRFTVSGPHILNIEGVTDPIRAFTVTGRSDDALSFDGPFVGREEVCSQILSAYLKHDAKTQNGFIICGDAGIGKTRLVAEILSRIRTIPGSNPPFLYVRAKVNRTATYSVIRELLTNFLTVHAQDGVEAIKKRVMQVLATDEEVAEVFAQYVCGRTGDLTEGRLFVYLHLILTAAIKSAEHSPFAAIVCLDNYHLIDQESLNFFRFYLQGAVSKPFFLLAGRPETHSVVDVFYDLQHILLEPLQNDVASDLITDLWGGDCPVETRSGIVENAAGIPLFIEEYVRYMKKHDDLTSLPPTVQNIFLSRIEGYEESIRDLIKKLSVFRQEFSEEDAVRIQQETRADPEIVTPVLGFFVREGILRQDGNLFRFRHDAFKRTLYESLLNYNKKIIHRIIAKNLESSTDPDTLGLLYHFSRAGEYDEMEHIILSTPAIYVDLNYLVYIDQLIEHRKDSADIRLLQPQFYKAAVLLNNGRTADALNTVQEIIHVGISKKRAEYLAKAYHLMEGYYLRSDDLENVRFFGSKALKNYELSDTGDRAVENVLFILAEAELNAGNFDENQRVIDSMKPMKSDGGSCPRDIAMLDRLLAQGRYTAVIETARTRLRGEVHSYSLDEPDLNGILSQAFWQACDFEQAGEAAETALASGTLPEDASASFYAMISAAAYFNGEMDKYSRNIRQALYYLSRVQNDHDIVMTAAIVAKSLYLAKDFERFLDVSEQALVTGLKTGPMRPTFSLLVMCAEYAVERGDTQAAEFYLREADSIEHRNILLGNKERIIYYYLWSTMTEEEESQTLVQRAIDQLEEELANLYDDSLKDRLTSFRSFSIVSKQGNLS